MYLNGLILISAFLDSGSAEFAAGNDEPYAAYLPTYAAIAHYHGRLAQSARLAAFVRGGHEAR